MDHDGCGIVECVLCGIELPGIRGGEMDGVKLMCTTCGEGELVIDVMGCFGW